MIFEFSKAPMHYVDGIAAFKAGEWPGKLSCKFGPTRKVIRPKTEGIIFNENEPYPMPKRRQYSQGPSKELEFKPCLRIYKNYNESKVKTFKEGIKVIKPAFTEGKGRPEKKHYFDYREEYVKEVQSKVQEYSSKQVLNEEFRSLSKIGFSKKALENLPNNKLLGLNFSNNSTFSFTNQHSYQTTNRKEENKKDNRPLILDKAAKSMWQKKQQEKMNNIKIEKENLKKDTDYVKQLDTWEKGFLPKIK